MPHKNTAPRVRSENQELKSKDAQQHPSTKVWKIKLPHCPLKRWWSSLNAGFTYNLLQVHHEELGHLCANLLFFPCHPATTHHSEHLERPRSGDEPWSGHILWTLDSRGPDHSAQPDRWQNHNLASPWHASPQTGLRLSRRLGSKQPIPAKTAVPGCDSFPQRELSAHMSGRRPKQPEHTHPPWPGYRWQKLHLDFQGCGRPAHSSMSGEPPVKSCSLSLELRPVRGRTCRSAPAPLGAAPNQESMAEGSVSTFQLLLSRNEVLVQNMLASGDVAHHMCLQGFQINSFMRTDWTGHRKVGGGRNCSTMPAAFPLVEGSALFWHGHEHDVWQSQRKQRSYDTTGTDCKPQFVAQWCAHHEGDVCVWKKGRCGLRGVATLCPISPNPVTTKWSRTHRRHLICILLCRHRRMPKRCQLLSVFTHQQGPDRKIDKQIFARMKRIDSGWSATKFGSPNLSKSSTSSRSHGFVRAVTLPSTPIGGPFSQPYCPKTVASSDTLSPGCRAMLCHQRRRRARRSQAGGKICKSSNTAEFDKLRWWPWASSCGLRQARTWQNFRARAASTLPSRTLSPSWVCRVSIPEYKGDTTIAKKTNRRWDAATPRVNQNLRMIAQLRLATAMRLETSGDVAPEWWRRLPKYLHILWQRPRTCMCPW